MGIRWSTSLCWTTRLTRTSSVLCPLGEHGRRNKHGAHPNPRVSHELFAWSGFPPSTGSSSMDSTSTAELLARRDKESIVIAGDCLRFRALFARTPGSIGVSVRFARVAQLDRASASGAEGCGFDPRLAHQRRNEATAELEPTIRTGKRKAESWEAESLRGKTVRP